MNALFDLSELDAALLQLGYKRAPGKDGVLNEMLTNIGPITKDKLLLIINQSWESGKFPDSWREAVIIPIPKPSKDNSTQLTVERFRPISLLSVIGKLMERMVNNRLIAYLERNKLLNHSQTAYRRNLSTEDQLALIAQEIENAFQDKMNTVAMFVDLTKAFDKMWRQGLLLKLLYKKISGKMYDWIKDFLRYRTARVRVDGKLSHRVPIAEGTPQGGVISSTLFLVFIDDITDGLINRISHALHADDLALWTAETSLAAAGSRIQTALDKLSEWTDNWGVELNKTKTVYTVFSLSPKVEVLNLRFQGRKLELDETPKYLGLKLDRRLTWKTHLEEAQAKAMRRLSIMKKLAGTTWGAVPKVLKTIYTGAIRPVMEYGNTAWATAANTNTNQLSKVQNAGLRIITGAMKTTPIRSMEVATDLRPLDNRREEKIYIQSEKIRRLNNHKLHDKINELTKNRLKRTSFNHLARRIRSENENITPVSADSIEPLTFNSHNPIDATIEFSLTVPGVEQGKTQPITVLKTLSLAMLNDTYDDNHWAQVYTDGSADEAVRNGGAGVFIKLPHQPPISHSYATGEMSTNFRAEAIALHRALETLETLESLPPQVVVLTDCLSILQLLQNPARGDSTISDIRNLLNILSNRVRVVLQWIPAHCGIPGNEKADSLAKEGTRKEQFHHRISYSEAKTLIKNKYSKNWSNSNQDRTIVNDNIAKLDRKGQTILFRLRTGHCRLNAHMYKIAISDSPNCPCQTALQTPEHVLQDCPLYAQIRHTIWPAPTNINTKLHGSKEELQLTIDFIDSAGLSV